MKYKITRPRKCISKDVMVISLHGTLTSIRSDERLQSYETIFEAINQFMYRKKEEPLQHYKNKIYQSGTLEMQLRVLRLRKPSVIVLKWPCMVSMWKNLSLFLSAEYVNRY